MRIEDTKPFLKNLNFSIPIKLKRFRAKSILEIGYNFKLKIALKLKLLQSQVLISFYLHWMKSYSLQLTELC